jgi:hypothetical protein
MCMWRYGNGLYEQFLECTVDIQAILLTKMFYIDVNICENLINSPTYFAK